MTLNAKQRRQLLRKHQHQQEATSRLVPEFSAEQKRDQNSSAELDIASQLRSSKHPSATASSPAY
ncbi:hypothetical protein CCR75_001679 [Bremia lactucae]|uniref:Uncharacterized protein n=1 Tax=Bremia lactucae TaxID=4779 RepID=A0A976FLQ9_BRELC|nr:hypothetical protein CCR75_001679 [Bremia lactucae]